MAEAENCYAGELFVDGWSVKDVLGEGAFGEVKLLINQNSGQLVAMKVMELESQTEYRKDLVRKELLIHKVLDAPNIIKYYGERTEGDTVYLFLEYAPGGALYDHIDPNFGMSPWEAQKYFRELLAGVNYMHSLGIVHRDIKPENLLLDSKGTLKICDFGLATKYRHLGKERILESRCGTVQYIAPEVIKRSYRGAPADIWSCGIVFVAMLAGDVPWGEAAMSCPQYVDWIQRADPLVPPWILLDTMALSLVRNLLTADPEERFIVAQILEHRWMLKTFERPSTVADSFCYEENDSQTSEMSVSEDVSVAQIYFEAEAKPKPKSESESEPDTRICTSQPLPNHEEDDEESYTEAKICFSQPTDVGALILASQNPQSSQEPVFQNLVRRMTRFFVSTSCEGALEALRSYLDRTTYRWKRNDSMITITTMDKRHNPLVFKAIALSMGDHTLMDFRLSKGCGLAFKRCFAIIKVSLNKIILEGLVSWPTAAANKTLTTVVPEH